ncbi:MAG TPA: response regulator [Caulobacteraceae bacterium]|jgi:signal transduction histidine kinase/CheY-like chemotaxis protein|nr:response regulator [Caulobacteraceae bacterium]
MGSKRRLPFGELIAGLGVLFAAVFAVSLIVWINIGRMEIADAADREAREVLIESDAVVEALLEQEAGLRGYVATAGAPFLQDYQEGRERLARALPQLASLTDDDPEQHGRVATLTALTETWADSIATPEIALIRKGDQARAQAMVQGRSGQRRIRAMLGVMNALRHAETDIVVVRAQAQARAYITSRWTLVLGALAAVAAAGLLGGRSLWLLVRSRDTAERAMAQVQAANRAKTQFLANMSHEIRTPLNGVAGVAEALGRSGLSPKQLELVETIRQSARTVDNLLADILTLARDATGADDAEAASFHLAELVRGVLAEYRPAAEAKGIELSSDLPDGAEVEVEGDAPRLRRILSSLLSNAVKFTDQGAVRLIVSARGLDRYQFEVKDTGHGFDPARRQRMFEAFSQFDETSTRRHGGAGLGLAIARLAASRIGGRLDCDSTPGVGSTFTLNVPLALAKAMAPRRMEPPAPVAADEAQAPVRILIVDDHPTNRQVLELILDQVGVDWVSVEDGQQAVIVVERQPFSAILMDIQMPVMDGLTATREIRRRERETGRPGTPVIIVSANCQPEQVEEGVAAGAQRHLSKPINAQHLLEALSEVLEAA